MLSKEPSNTHFLHFRIDFLISAAASYNVFISSFFVSSWSSVCWIALSLPFFMLTLSDSLTRFGQWNSMSAISFWSSCFNALQFMVSLATLFALRISLYYASCNWEIGTIFPSLKVISVKVKNSILATGHSNRDLRSLYKILVTLFNQQFLWYLMSIECASLEATAVLNLTASFWLSPYNLLDLP